MLNNRPHPQEKASLFQDSAGAIPTKMIHWAGFAVWAISQCSRFEPAATVVISNILIVDTGNSIFRNRNLYLLLSCGVKFDKIAQAIF